MGTKIISNEYSIADYIYIKEDLCVFPALNTWYIFFNHVESAKEYDKYDLIRINEL